MVTIPNLDRYRQGDFIQYMNNVLQIVTIPRAIQLGLVPQRENLNTAMSALNNAWQPQVGSEVTPEIQDIDIRRDMVLVGLKMTVDNWATNHFDPARRNAAYIVSNNIGGHGDRVYKMRYQQETATINAIIKDLDNELDDAVNRYTDTENGATDTPQPPEGAPES